MNEEEHNSSIEDIQSDDSVNLAELRKKLELSNMQLLELTYNDEKFMSSIDDLNSNGVNCVQNEDYRQALIYFNENEKILEYAASCGKTIDRSVIIATLHNQACVNQKLWQLQKSANYLEAIIYNINTHLESTQAKIGDLTTLQGKQQKQIDAIASFIKKKEAYALYKLQFCAVNSQIRKHQVSIQSAKNSITIMKQVCRLTLFMAQQIKQNTQNTTDINIDQQMQPILKQLLSLQETLDIKNYQIYLLKARTLLKNKSNNSQQLHLMNKFKHLRTFSIGKLMQLSPLMIKEFHFKQNIFQLLKYENIITKALYLGISFFTVGTEMRFIASKENDENSQDYRTSNAFLLSSVYHIYAILIVLTYVPVDTIFLNHLLSSFNNHYFVDLEKNSEQSDEEQQYQPEQFQLQRDFQYDEIQKKNGLDGDQLMHLNSKSSVEEKEVVDFSNGLGIVSSPLAQKINETGVKKISKLEGLLTQSVNKSGESQRVVVEKNKSISGQEGKLSEIIKRNSQESQKKRSKNQVKKHFFRSKSPKQAKISKKKDKKDQKQSSGNILGTKRSVTGTTTNHFTSNQISRGKSQELSKKKRKKDVFSIYSPMTVDDQMEAAKNRKQMQKQKPTKVQKNSKTRPPRNSHNREKKKICIYTHRDKRDNKQVMSLVRQTKSKEDKKTKSKSLGKNSQGKKKKNTITIHVKGIEQTHSMMKKNENKQKITHTRHINTKIFTQISQYRQKDCEGQKQKNGMASKSKNKMKNGKDSGGLKMNKVEGKRKNQKISRGK